MEITARGWNRDHGENVVVQRELRTAKIGRFENYSRSETYITPEVHTVRSSSFSRRHSVSAEPCIEIRFDAKVVLNGDYLIRLAFDRNEIASLFYLLYAECPLEDLMDHMNGVRSLHESGPVPSLPFNPLMLKKVSELELSVRSANCLHNAEIHFVGDLVQKNEVDLLRMGYFGRKALNEIKEVLAKLKLRLGMEVPSWPPANIEELARRFEVHK